MKKHLTIDFFKLLLVFLILTISLQFNTVQASIIHDDCCMSSGDAYSNSNIVSSLTSTTSTIVDKATADMTSVPLPAAGWLFASGLMVLVRVLRVRRVKTG